MWCDRAPWLAFMGGAVPAGRLTTGFWPVATRPGCALLGTVKTGVGLARLNTGTLVMAISSPTSSLSWRGTRPTKASPEDLEGQVLRHV